METKVCTKCGVEKTVDNFSKNAGKRDGLYSWCIECNSEHRKERRAAGKDKTPAPNKASERSCRTKNAEINSEKVIPEGYVRTCTKCGETKPVSEFYRDRGNPSGFSYLCKECKLAVIRASKARARTRKGQEEVLLDTYKKCIRCGEVKCLKDFSADEVLCLECTSYLKKRHRF